MHLPEWWEDVACLLLVGLGVVMLFGLMFLTQ